MKLRFALAALAVLAPAAALAGPDLNRMLATAKADPVQAASLHDAFCVGNANVVPQWICDQIKAAERPILKEPAQSLALK